MSTGMPRPLSRMEMEPSTWIVTSIRSQKPARCSSTELSNTSDTQWCNARSSVPPMYMPGFFRTASNPSSFPSFEASYFIASEVAVFVFSACSKTFSSDIKNSRSLASGQPIFSAQNFRKNDASTQRFVSCFLGKKALFVGACNGQTPYLLRFLVAPKNIVLSQSNHPGNARVLESKTSPQLSIQSSLFWPQMDTDETQI